MPEKLEFLFGFKVLADKLGPAVVGEPIEGQWTMMTGVRQVVLQRTTKGYMVTEQYLGLWREAMFLPAALPKA